MKKFIYLFALIAAIFISTEGYCEFTSLQELNQPERVIGISETRAALTALKRDLPNAQLAFLPDNEGYIAVQLGKIDAYASSRNVMEFAIAHGLNGVKLLPDSIGDPTYVAVGISRASKIKDIKAKINEFLSELRADGTLDDMYRRWVIDSDLNMPDIGSYEKSGTKITVGTVGTIQPFSFYVGDKLTGYEIELGQRFAKWLGAEVEFKVYDYGGIIAAAAVGNIDLIMANLNITQERAEKIDYSDVLYIEESTLMVKSDSSVSSHNNSNTHSSVSDLAGKKIAVVTGTTHPEITLKFVPTAQLAYFDSIIDTFAALKAGKVDAICTGIPIAKFIMAEDDSFEFFGEQLTHVECSAIFAKTDTGRKLCDEFSEFFKSLWDNGKIKEIESIWLGKDDSKKTITDYSKLPAPNGTLRMAVDLSMMPFVYVKDNMIAGYDVDCAVRFCEAYGYGLEIMPMSFAAIIPAVLSGKCDFAMGGITRTDEREESVLFSYPNIRTGNSFVIRKPETESAPSRIKEFDGKKIGVPTGSIHAEVVREVLPSAEIFYFDGLANMVTALASGKIDAIATDDSIAFELERENTSLTHLEEYLNTFDNAFIFAKTPESNKLRNELDEFIRSLKSDGTLDRLRDIWTGDDENLKTLPDYENYPDTNGVLNIALDNESPPFTYVKDGRVVGYDVDIIVRFCKAKGYRPEFSEMDFSGVIPAVISGKCNLGIGAITITEERRESVNFSEPVYTGGSVILVRKQDSSAEYAGIADLSGKKIGVQTGTTHPGITQEFVPTATLEYFESQADIFTALKAGKVDAVCTNIPIARYVIAVDDSYTMIGSKVVDIECAPIFPKNPAGEKLCAQFSEFNKAMWEDGTIQEIDSIWYGQDESKRTVKDYTKLPAPNGVLRMAADLSMVPFTYMKENKIVGYDVDCVIRFCEAYGYGLEIVPMSFGAIIPALQSGKCDFAACVVTYTEERAKQVLYAYPNIKSGVAFYVRKPEPVAQALTQDTDTTSFIEELKASFGRTFIREDRWKLFIEGIVNTMIITVLSIIFGTILGFAVYLACRRGNVIANLATRFSVWLIQGMPMVVLLMILYYIIFGQVDIAGIWVAVIAFSMTFGASFYAMLCSGVNALDKGQTEAAYALGFTDSRAFFTIILPQAALHFMPAYKGEVTSLIKATAIVGYIAVQDLTKMGDIVRSRTYEAFFPLIAIAIIYFVLAGMLNIIVGAVNNYMNPRMKKREDILKGINTHD